MPPKTRHLFRVMLLCSTALALSGCFARLEPDRSDTGVGGDPEGREVPAEQPPVGRPAPGQVSPLPGSAPSMLPVITPTTTPPPAVFDAGVTPIADAGNSMLPDASIESHPALPGAPRSSTSNWLQTDLAELDGYALARSVEQLESLTVLREGKTLFKVSRAEIREFIPPPDFHLTSLAFKKRWLDTFWAWVYQQSSSANADAVRIASALARYLTGVAEVTVGAECWKPIASLTRSSLGAGVPGDDVRSRLHALIEESEASGDAQQFFDGDNKCRTTLRPSAPARPVAVVIELPSKQQEPVADTAIYSIAPDGTRVRIGVPVPAIKTRRDEHVLDTHILAASYAQLSSLELRRAGQVLFTRTRAELSQATPTPGGQHLTELEFRWAWINVFRAWHPWHLENALFDPRRIAVALTSQYIGVSQVSYGPECGPISGGYMYGSIAAGLPGDDARERSEAEFQRSEAAIKTFVAQTPTTSCITAVRAQPSGVAAAVNVVIDLPADIQAAVDDTRIWSGTDEARVRAGAPALRGGQLWRGRDVR